MRAILTVLVVAMLAVMPVWGQPEEGAAPPPPPVEEEAQPARIQTPPPVVEAPAPAPITEAPAPSPQQELVDRAIRYYEQTQEAPPEVGSFLATNPWLGTIVYVIRRLSSVIIWLFLFLLIGRGGSKLLRPLFGARPVPAQEQSGYRAERAQQASGPDRRAAAADVVAWLVALAIACEAVGLTWFGALFTGLLEFLGGIVGSIVWMALLIGLAALIVWSFSENGRRLVLALLGSFYLTRSAGRPPEGHVFTLPDGRAAVIVSTDALHSVMQPTEGGPAVPMPNADLMEQYYNWAKPVGKSGAGAGDAAAT